jgi:polyhydroxyalkanoate synthase
MHETIAAHAETRGGRAANILPDIPPSEQRREASTWQGGTRPRYPGASVEHAHVDLALNAALGRLTGYVSPAALAGAWHDWATHLLLSPAKQMELGVQAVNNMQRWVQYSASAHVRHAGRARAAARAGHPCFS